MCYVVFLSTSSPADLASRNTGLLQFKRDLGNEPAKELLNHPFRWLVGSRSICSCGFRHLSSPELGFSGPVDWFPEEQEDVDATAEFFEVVRSLVLEGHQVDCVDAWSQTEKSLIRQMQVPVSTLRDGQFRFFENHHFMFKE